MLKAALTYIVVENSGMLGERDVKTFPSYPAAAGWMERWYTEEERDASSPACLHPDICAEQPDGSRSYEVH